MATMTLDDLVTQLRAAYGAQLSSVVLYGSAAAGEHVPKRSDYNVLVLLDRMDAASLAGASAAARAWHDAGNPPPMTMTVSEWRGSSDVFPMEYADILARHRVLHGAAPFDGLSVSRENLRLQLEQQAMGKLLQLRQGALLAGTDGARQLELIEASLSTVMVLFRAVLRLTGEEPAGDKTAVSQRVGTLAGFGAGAFVRAARHQAGVQKIVPAEAGTVLAQYLSGVERLNAYLDTFNSQERPS
ncbi:MAG: nucleotidyltransferase domain-containing protein [Gemmatimonadaceae bacterium]